MVIIIKTMAIIKTMVTINKIMVIIKTMAITKTMVTINKIMVIIKTMAIIKTMVTINKIMVIINNRRKVSEGLLCVKNVQLISLPLPKLVIHFVFLLLEKKNQWCQETNSAVQENVSGLFTPAYTPTPAVTYTYLLQSHLLT